jgi:predicted DNA-binding transcriptional regulator YafY
MPRNKSAHTRYRIIDECLTNTMRKYPGREDLQNKIVERLGESISLSMIDKDIREMRDQFSAPIAYHTTHKGYYYTEEGYSFREFPLTYDEIEALDLAPAMLQQLKGTRLYEQFLHAVNKVIEGYRISKTLGKSEDEIIQTETALVSGGTQWLEQLLKGITEKQCLAIDYQAYGGPVKTHDFSPYLIKEYRNRWYLVGYSARAEMILVLGLDRIKSIANSAAAYYQDPGFNSSDYFKYSFGITQFAYEEPEEVVLSFIPEQAPYLLSQPIHASQEVLVNNKEEFRIRIKVYLSHELQQFILGNIDKIRSVEPERLRDMVKEKLQCVRL